MNFRLPGHQQLIQLVTLQRVAELAFPMRETFSVRGATKVRLVRTFNCRRQRLRRRHARESQRGVPLADCAGGLVIFVTRISAHGLRPRRVGVGGVQKSVDSLSPALCFQLLIPIIQCGLVWTEISCITVKQIFGFQIAKLRIRIHRRGRQPPCVLIRVLVIGALVGCVRCQILSVRPERDWSFATFFFAELFVVAFRIFAEALVCCHIGIHFQIPSGIERGLRHRRSRAQSVASHARR